MLKHYTKYLHEKFSIIPNDIIITGEPPQIKKLQYDECLTEIVKRLSAVSGVKSIYHFGEIKAPGISDLDVMVILDPEYIPECVALTASMDKEILLHDPFYIPVNLLGSFKEIFPMANLVCAYGEPETKLSNELSDKQQLLIAVDFYVSVFSKSFMWKLWSGNYNARDCLVLFRLLCHSLERIGGMLPAMPKEWADYISTIADVRPRWAELTFEEKQKTLLSLMIKSLLFSHQLAGLIRELLVTNFSCLSRNEKSTVAYYSGRLSCHFDANYDISTVLEKQVELVLKHKHVISVLPSEFGDLMLAYSDSSISGPYSNFLRKGLVLNKTSAPLASDEDVLLRAEFFNGLFSAYGKHRYYNRSPLSFYDYIGGKLSKRLMWGLLNRALKLYRYYRLS